MFFRTSLAALVLLPFALSRGGLGAVRGKWVPLLFFAGFEVALPWLLLSSAEQHISSALAGLLISAVPLVSVVTEPVWKPCVLRTVNTLPVAALPRWISNASSLA